MAAGYQYTRISRVRLAALAAGISIVCWVGLFTAFSAAICRVTSGRVPVLPAGISVPQEGYAYFFDLVGDFEKIAVATGEEATHGQLPPARGIVDPFQRSGFDGCVFCGARYDANSERLYALMAKEATLSADGTKHQDIVALELPEMHAVGVIPLGVEAPSAVLVTPDGHKLVVSYEDSPAGAQADVMEFVLSLYSAPGLALLHTFRETTTQQAYIGGGVVNTQLSEKAYFGTDGKTIYDGFDKTQLMDDRITKEEIDPLKLLAKSEDPQLEPFRLMNPRTKTYSFHVDYADASAGKILVELNVGKAAPQGVCTIDATSNAISHVIGVPNAALGTAHLSPDARQILIEGSEFRHRANAKPDEPQAELFRTGRISVYDAASGKMLHELQSSELAGPQTHLLCFVGTAQAFYAARGHLYRVNLMKNSVTQVAAVPQFGFDQYTECITADR